MNLGALIPDLSTFSNMYLPNFINTVVSLITVDSTVQDF